MEERKPFSCFDRAFLLKMIFAALVVMGLAFVARAFERGSAARIGVVTLIAGVLGYTIVESLRSIRRLDEMNQRIHLESIAVSFGLTAVLGSALSMLERAGVPVAGWEELLWAFMAVGWGVSVLVIQRRYR